MRKSLPTPGWMLPAFLLALALVGCERPDTPTAVAPRPASAAFVAEQQAWRDQRRADLTRPDGWTSLVGLHWIDPGAHYVGSASDNGIRLAVGPPQLGMLDLKGDAVWLDPSPAAALTLDGRPLTDAHVRLRADDAAEGPSVLGFDEGRGQATVIRRGGRYALRVRHADAPARTGFLGIDYWPADPAWVLDARFVPHPAGTTMPVANIIGITEPVPNPGAVEFERDGRRFRLEALDEGEDTLFLVFADRTSGHGSYGAGRFLDVPRPDAQGRLRIDFNHAYNPPCAFTPFATCPLPPPSNRLDLAVTAGEKAYRGPH